MPTVGLFAEPEGELLGANRGPRLLRPQLEPLALASVRIAARAKHGLEILPACLVGGHDGDRCIRHLDKLRGCPVNVIAQSLALPVAILRTAVASGKALGIDVTIFNPKLDEDGAIARRLVKALGDGLVARGG
jgi:hypothetical protein